MSKYGLVYSLENKLNKCVGDFLHRYDEAKDDEGKIDPQVGFAMIKDVAADFLEALTPVIRAD